MNKKHSLAIGYIIAQVLAGPHCSFAAEPTNRGWSEFRNGGSSAVQGELPQQWDSKSIAWQHELIGYGQSTPIIHNGRVIVTSVEGPMKDECVVSCFDLKSGRETWVYRTAATTKGASNYMASRAAPTPIADDRGVFAFFESGDCLAIDHSGKPLWQRSLTTDYGKFDNNHGLGASPTQTESLVIINVEHKGPSYLVALDKNSGATTWKADRNSSSSWSSPIVVNTNGQQQVVVSSGGTVDAYDTTTGKSLWSIGGLDGNSVPSPTASGNLLYVGARVPEFGGDGEAAKSNLCISLGDGNSASTSPGVAWRASKAISDYASPVVCGECVYYLNKVGVLYCLSKSTGEPLYMERLGTQCWATPIVSHDRVFFFGKDGKTQIVRSGPKFDLISSNLLWESDHIPKPESYVENNSSSHGHGEASAAVGAAAEQEQGQAQGQGSGAVGGPGATVSSDLRGSGARGGRPGGAPGGGMLAALMKADADANGVLSAEEIPADFKPMIARIDTNSDGSLDQAELKAMADSFAARRADSRDTARDPIVYGAAAVEGAIVVRTGTRLYCIQ